MTITRIDFVSAVEGEMKKTYPHISRKEVKRILELFLSQFGKNLAAGHRIELRGLGVFSTKMRKPKIARNPRTKEAIPLPPRRVVVFKPSKILKMMITQGG